MRGKAHQRREQAEWERARWQMFIAMQMHPYMKPHAKKKTPQAWIPFAWERAATVTKEDREVTADEAKQLGNLLEDFRNKRRN